MRLPNDKGFVFVALTPGLGTEPWVSNGKPGGTFNLKDISALSGSSFPGLFIQLGGKLLFSAKASSGESRLWQTDGTKAGTIEIVDTSTGTFSGVYTTEFAKLGGYAYFPGTQEVLGAFTGSELWRTDGTAAGTQLAADSLPGLSSGLPYGLTVMGGEVYFIARTGKLNKYALIATAGTPGTERVVRVLPADSGAKPQGLSRSGQHLFFTADLNDLRQVWVSDGTTAEPTFWTRVCSTSRTLPSFLWLVAMFF